MSYDIGRTNAIRRAYAGHIKSFVERYIRGRKTVVLLPGGMGSQLDFSPRPYDGVPMSFADYETSWMDIGVVFDRDALKLEIDDQGRDKDGHIVVPNGPLRFLVVAYDGTARYFQERDYNYIVFGYDWRRPVEECAGFLEDFLVQLRKSVFNKHHENPLPMTTLLCHSQGGLVAKLFLHRIFSASDWFDKVITAGTPFYGTWGHQRRFFIGQQPLNILYGARRIAKLAATLPGPYTLMFIGRGTFDADHERLGLAPGAYPVTDPESGAAMDPYDAANLNRYPQWVNRDHLETARRIRETIALPLPDAIRERFYNIRTLKDRKTPVSLHWKALPPGFDPDQGDESPVKPDKKGGGDGTVPGWAAWHAHSDAAHRVELKKASDHTKLMEHLEVLENVRFIVEKDVKPTKALGKDQMVAAADTGATGHRVRRFFHDVAKNRTTREDARGYERSIWQTIYKEMLQ